MVRRHVRYIDGKLAIISDYYFDEQIVAGTELAKPQDTTRENILAEVGYGQVYDIDESSPACPALTRWPDSRYRPERRSRNTSGGIPRLRFGLNTLPVSPGSRRRFCAI